jgi:calcineurin-like phosphoesterase family protein
MPQVPLLGVPTMMKTFFTSDTHYGHGNIISYCCRPFTDRGDMNDTMVTAHNAVVGPHDLVVHLGDFCFGSASYISDMVSRLNGHFMLIRGNHDRKLGPLKEAGWDVRTTSYLTLEDYGWSVPDWREDSFKEAEKLKDPSRNVRLFLSHKPQFEETWQADYHLCGHVHTAWKKRESNRRRDPARESIINVGVDQWGYVPRTWPELLAG